MPNEKLILDSRRIKDRIMFLSESKKTHLSLLSHGFVGSFIVMSMIC